MACRDEAPENHRQRIAHSCADAIDDPTAYGHPHRVRTLKSNYEVPVVDIVPSQIILEQCFQHSKQLPVHVILRDSEEQQRTDDPAKMPGLPGKTTWVLARHSRSWNC